MLAVPTLSEFILGEQSKQENATGDLSKILNAIELASKIVNSDINKAGLLNIFGGSGEENIQGEIQQKLDVIANEHFKEALAMHCDICAFASEEDDNIIVFDSHNNEQGQYVIAIDPIDGSSNIDYGIPVGTIFSIFHRKSSVTEGSNINDFLRTGSEQVVAGYVLYGTSTMFVYTSGDGVNGFTLDPSIGTYFLSHPDIKIPSHGNIYSINEANFSYFSKELKAYINHLKSELRASMTARYVGSLVADFHRNLLKGGIYIYPAMHNQNNGKLRLLYECNPLAFIVEQAGGKATDGRQRILDIEPTELHQRTPLFIGSMGMFNQLDSFLLNEK